MNLTIVVSNDGLTRIVKARRLDQWFAVHHQVDRTEFVVTHILTGFRACYAPNLKAARDVARSLTSAFGDKWNFVKPTKRAMKSVHEAKSIIIKAGCFHR